MTGRPMLPPAEASILEILDDRARRTPDRQIFCYLNEGEHETERFTYVTLQRRAQAIAAELQKHASPGDRVVLLYPPGLEVIAALFGCFYAGTIAVPACPPRMDVLEDGLSPLAAIVKDCGPAVMLVGAALFDRMEPACASRPEFASCTLLTSEAIPDSSGAEFQPASIDRGTFALLQYTSGSTGDPKGVILTHGNILANSYSIQCAFGHRTSEATLRGGEWRAACWLPYFHDMGLIGNILQPVYVDGPSYFMSPVMLLQRPVRWLEMISRYRVHTSAGPNFAYDLCVRRVTDAQKANLDLSTWEVAAIGAEPVSPGTIDRFSEAFACCGFRREAFYPCYGLAESTLIVSGGEKATLPRMRSFQPVELEYRPQQAESAAPTAAGGGALTAMRASETEAEGALLGGGTEQVLVGCGHAWTDHEIVLADPETLCESLPGAVGEIWFAGPSVARGYWGRDDETRETFGSKLHNSGHGPFLRTGDLGVIRDGELYVCGRIKDLIVIRGRNHYPQDIEQTVAGANEAFPPSSGAAIGCLIDGEEQLVILQEIDRRTRDVDVADLTRDIRRRIAEQHQLQIHELVFLQQGSLPKTTSGKVRRREASERYLVGKLIPWQPRTRASGSVT